MSETIWVMDSDVCDRCNIGLYDDQGVCRRCGYDGAWDEDDDDEYDCFDIDENDIPSDDNGNIHNEMWNDPNAVLP